jgi:hypothetical protein
MSIKPSKRDLISTLWIFATVNYIYCDVFSLHYAPNLQQLLTGNVDGLEISEEFLLVFSVIMELPMLMILLTKILPLKVNRVANIAIALIMSAIQIWSLTMGGNTYHYLFFSVVEIATTLLIVYLSITWVSEEYE